jgi:prophage tail gpP-like protein
VPPLTDIDQAAIGSIQISLPFVGANFPRFLAYEFTEHYLIPSSSFWFDLDEDELSAGEKSALVPGQGVSVTINGQLQMCGYVDDVDVRCSRTGGTIWHVEGRDWISPIVDSHVDPKVQFSTNQTLEQLITQALSTFGSFPGANPNAAPSVGGGVSPIVLVTDSAANNNVITGATRGTRTNKNGTILKSVLNHQVKPYQHEGVWEFLSRVAQRFGLWMRPTADGTTIIVSTPDFTQDPSYTLQRLASGGVANNVLEGGIKFSRKNQPSMILASGFGGGGVFANSTLRAAIVNPCIQTNVAPTLVNYPNVTIVTTPVLGGASQFSQSIDILCRPLYLYDPESHTQGELESFLIRSLSLRMREALVGNYSIEGHTLGGAIVGIDTIAQVQDDRSNWSGPLWVQDRTFSKKPGSGTTSHVTLIRPGTLAFGSVPSGTTGGNASTSTTQGGSVPHLTVSQLINGFLGPIT